MRRPYPMPARRAVAAALLPIAFACSADEGNRAFTVRDAIEATRVIDPSVNDSSRTTPLVSPDGRRFFVVTQKGILDTNEREYRLLVFEVTEARNSPVSATEAAVMRTRSNWPGIYEASWAGNDRIAFLGAEGCGPPQVRFANLHGKVETRSAAPSGVQTFATNENGDVLYSTLPVPDAAAVKEALAGGFVAMKHDPGFNLFSDAWRENAVEQHTALFHQRRGEDIATEVEAARLIPRYSRLFAFWIAPDGGKAILSLPTVDYLEQWRGYENPEVKEYVDRALKAGGVLPTAWPYPQFFILDLVSHELEPLLVAPGYLWRDYTAQAGVVWSNDGKSALLVNTMLPIAQATAMEPEQRVLALRHPAIVEVNLTTRQVTPVMFLSDGHRRRPSRISWSDDGSRIDLTAKDPDSGKAYQLTFRRERSGWSVPRVRELGAHGGRTNFAVLAGGKLEGGIDQGINRPPRVVVRDARSHRVLYELELNPQFTQVELSPMETVRWIDEHGLEWTGGLMYPRGFREGKRFPLIIQTHGYNPQEFLVDSMMFGSDRPASFSGMSARALSAAGFFVLQEYQSNSHARANYFSPEEGPQFIRSWRAAIDSLSKRGLVDSSKVGVIGFSRTCYHVKYALAHGDLDIAAAAVTDGWDYGYFQILIGSHTGEARKVYGTDPVGEGLLPWLKDAPTFNAHKIRAPVRIEAIGMRTVVAEFEMYATLQLVGVPTELTIYPDGWHRLIKPKERFRSQQSNVDWFRFWIKGEEDEAAAKKSRYDRWRKMREEWSQRQ